MAEVGGFWWPFAVMLAGAAATYVWRAAGVALSGRLSPESAAFEWIACIAYALLTGLISRMILLPSGLLAATPLLDRLLGTILALAVFFAARRSMPLGVGAGIATLALLTWGRAALL